MATKMEHFSSTEALRFGWSKTMENLRTLIPIGLIGLMLALLQNVLSRAGGLAGLLALVVQVAQWALMLVYVRTALKLRDDQPLGDWRLDEMLNGFFPYLLTGVLYMLIVGGGLILLVVPGVIWAVMFGFAGFVVVDRKADPFEALRESRRLTHGRKGALLGFGLLCIAVNILGAIALGIGLMVTIPITAIATAWVFRWLQAHAPHDVSFQAPTVAHGTTALLVLGALFLAACAPGFNEAAGSASADGIIAGFWRGLWHGIIAPVTFIISLFSDKVGIYEVHNNGGWYNFGFLCGLICFHGGHAAGGAYARRRRARACNV
jgi:hypothetical protein